MTLVVARKSEGQICIVSDTKLSNEEFEIGIKCAPIDGVVKTTIINSSVSVSFAGNIYFAEKALKDISNVETVDNIVEILKSYHFLSNQKTEFLLCYAISDPVIFKFKNGECREVETSWIGDHAAFTRFQENIMGTPKKQVRSRRRKSASKPNAFARTQPQIHFSQAEFEIEKVMLPLFSKMCEAIDEVISAGDIDSVGGFKIVAIYNERFSYNFYTKNCRGNFSFTGFGMHPIGHGDAGEGAYTLNFFGNSPDFKSIGLHVRQANLGIVYHRVENGILRPQMHLLDEVDFCELIKDRFGLVAPFSTQDPLIKFSNDGKSAFSKRDYSRAFLLFEKALQHAKGKQMGEILYYKGVTLLNLRQYERAMEVFREAINIDIALKVLIDKLFNSSPRK